jgi:hypothetical protein
LPSLLSSPYNPFLCLLSCPVHVILFFAFSPVLYILSLSFPSPVLSMSSLSLLSFPSLLVAFFSCAFQLA